MECFMRNLPVDLTDQSLRVQLAPLVKALNLSDWACSTPRGKKWGTITFLREVDGETFLRQHSEVPMLGLTRNGRPRSRSRLFILNTHVYCAQSENRPDPFLLKSLEKKSEDAKNPDYKEPEKHDAVVFHLLSLSCGHYEFPQGKLAYVPDVEWPAHDVVHGSVKFAKRLMIVTFTYPGHDRIRLEIPYRTINEIVVSTRPHSMTLTLWEAPRIFQDEVQDEAQAQMTSLLKNLTFADGRNSRAQRIRVAEIPTANGRHGDVLGQTLVYSFALSSTDFHYKIKKLKQNQPLTLSNYNFTRTPPSDPSMDMTTALKHLRELLTKLTPMIPFDVKFQFQALVQNGYLLPQVVGHLLRLMQRDAANKKDRSSISGPASPISAIAVRKLIQQIEFPGPETDPAEFSLKELWAYIQQNERDARQGLIMELASERARQNLVMVFKVQVTPTRILLQGPEPEAKNRILRKFPNHTQYFARVQFCDEDGQDLHFNSRVSLEAIWKRFESVLENGISIAGRHYNFLGFSHSSLRAHAVWFMAPFVDDAGQLQTYFTVIPNLGKFTNITSPARCAARIGQAFSETPFSISLEEFGAQVESIDDVRSKNGSRVFSDGVGTISRYLMEEIQQVLPPKRNPPTCLQIRWAGAKGMLSQDCNSEGMTIRIRPSMVKFESLDKQNLEICDMANKPIPLVLNRQMIKILEDMGCSEKWFADIQDREVVRLCKITADVDNTVVFLRHQKIAEPIRFSQLIRKLSILGLDYKRDRFLRSVVEAVVLRELRLLKHKARIPVEKGVTLFGVMDEYKFLREGQVFITFDDLPGTDFLDLDGRKVLLTRSPALHPGDIQIVQAVVPPDDHPLRWLSNCVVFSQEGERDLPSQLSGGDLDGDIFNVIWDELAVKSCTKVFAPADYPRVEPIDIRREVKAEDMTKFFVQFMATDHLGLIAVKHMILADQKELGTLDIECLKLAELHSTAVDYSKTGIPVKEVEFRKLGRTKYRPDFLAPAPPAELVDRSEISFDSPLLLVTNEDDEDDNTGPNYGYYKSDKVLGKLFRAIDERRIWRDDIRDPAAEKAGPIWEVLVGYVIDECGDLGGVDIISAREEALGIYETYYDAIWSATLNYSEHPSLPISEIEVFTGCIFNKSGVQTRRQRDKSLQLKDEFDRIAKWAESAIRKRKSRTQQADLDQDQEDGGDDYYAAVETDIGPSGLELSVACLVVACTKKTPGNRRSGGLNTDSEFQSFKAVAASCALRELDIATRKRNLYGGGGGFVGVNGRR